MEFQKLFVGAKLYKLNNYTNEIEEIITIERVTKTQAIAQSGNCKFHIQLSINGSATRIGDFYMNYQLETPELKQKLVRQNMLAKLKKVDFEKLSIETLKELMAVLNK